MAKLPFEELCHARYQNDSLGKPLGWQLSVLVTMDWTLCMWAYKLGSENLGTQEKDRGMFESLQGFKAKPCCCSAQCIWPRQRKQYIRKLDSLCLLYFALTFQFFTAFQSFIYSYCFWRLLLKTNYKNITLWEGMSCLRRYFCLFLYKRVIILLPEFSFAGTELYKQWKNFFFTFFFSCKLNSSENFTSFSIHSSPELPKARS